MLQTLYIENIAVVKSVQLDFAAGLSVLSGETGAGKSVIIDSVNMVLGQKTTRDCIRHGAEKAFVSATFSQLPAAVCALLEEFGFETADELVISREITAAGKSSARLNGRPAAAQQLAQLGALLINIHGQHDNQELLDEERHIAILDRVGEYGDSLTAYRAAYETMREAKQRLDKLNKSLNDKDARLDYLKYQINELEAAEIKVGEYDSLSEERRLIMNSQKVAMALESAKAALDGGEESDGAVSELSDAARQMNSIARYSGAAADIAQRLDEMSVSLGETVYELSDLADKLVFDPGRQAEIEERMAQLERLRRKYGEDEQKMLDTLDNCKNEYDMLCDDENNSEKLQKEYNAAYEKALKLAQTLSEKRTKTAGRFTAAVAEQLSFLQMPNVRLSSEITDCPLNNNGCDRVVFLISANLGEPPKSISKIASGGELSRIMLAIKSVMSEHDEIPSLIFDEIDTGVSGKTAIKIGQKLKQVAAHRQVICVTHLAQIAAYASAHYLIRKSDIDNAAVTTVTALDENGRIDELARILGGETLNEAARENARELLREAGI